MSSVPGPPPGGRPTVDDRRGVHHRHALARPPRRARCAVPSTLVRRPRRRGRGPASRARPRGTRRRRPAPPRRRRRPSSRSPDTGSHPAGSRPEPMLAGRTSARTVQPWSRRSAATWPPMKPGRAGDQRRCSPQPPQRLLEARAQRAGRPRGPPAPGARSAGTSRGWRTKCRMPAAGREPPGRVHDAVEVGQAVAALVGDRPQGQERDAGVAASPRERGALEVDGQAVAAGPARPACGRCARR